MGQGKVCLNRRVVMTTKYYVGVTVLRIAFDELATWACERVEVG